MAALGLLQGFGRGLSQGAEMLNRGMAEDREVERQRMREASIEKRWQRQEQKDDDRYADSLKFREEEVNRQKERDAVSDSRYADQKKAQDEDRAAQDKYRSDQLSLEKEKLGITISERRRAEIEGALGGLQRDYEKSAGALERRHERLIDSAKQIDQQNGFAKDKDGYTETDRAYMARDKALGALSKEFTTRIIPVVRSYGDELKGTAFSSYLDDVKAEDARQKDHAGKQFLSDAGVIDAEGNFTEQQPKVKQGGRADLLKDLRAGSSGTNADTAAPVSVNSQPNFISGLNNGLSGAYGESGNADLSDASPLEAVGYGAGTLAGIGPGLLGDVFQLAGAGAKTTVQPIWTALTTKPSNLETERAKLLQQRFGGGLIPRADQNKK